MKIKTPNLFTHLLYLVILRPIAVFTLTILLITYIIGSFMKKKMLITAVVIAGLIAFLYSDIFDDIIDNKKPKQ